MDGDYGSDYITIEDEDGNEFELEHLDTFELDGAEYMAFLPADMDENDPDYGIILLKVVEEDGEAQLVTPDSDAELDRVYAYYMQLVFDEEDDPPET